MMKLFKKFAAAALAAVLAVSMLAGCGGKSYGTPEEEILKKINETRTSMKSGLEPLSNDAALAAAAGNLLDAFAANPKDTNTASGYMLTGQQITDALKSVTTTTTISKPVYTIPNTPYGSSIPMTSAIYVAPLSSNNNYSYTQISSGTNYYLLRRAAANDIGDINDYNGYTYGPGNYGFDVARNNKTKVGIATRTINGELFAMVLYDVEYVNG